MENTEKKENIQQGENIENNSDNNNIKNSDSNDDLQKELDSIKDKYLRLNADFENFRRRTSKEVSNTISKANKNLILKIIPLIDDFERYFKSSNIKLEEIKEQSEGINLIYSKLLNILSKEGLEKINLEKGKEFDPEKCEAISKIKSEANLKDRIVEIIENGYILNGDIIRFAKVIIGSDE